MFEFLIIIATFLVCFWTYRIIKWFINLFRKHSNNSYVLSHQKKIKDDIKYQQYLEWCKEKGQVAMNKKGFEEIRNNEKALVDRFNKIGIN